MTSKSSATATATSGFPIFGLLGILFVGLKLTGYITWSWWFVTLPFWGPIVIVLGLSLIAFGVWLAYQLFKGRR